jgi:uncharacterized membrane protein
MVEVHYVAGLLALLAGFIALYAPKGGRLHRRSGRLFAGAMAVMLGIAAFLAFFVVDRPENGIGALFTIYLVVTSLLTVTRRVDESRALTAGLAAAAVALGLAGVLGATLDDGASAPGSLLFGIAALACARSDFRLLRAGSIAEASRLRRHLWRMTLALWTATASFFLGQAKVLPEPVRHFGLLSIPVLAVLFTLCYWLRRTSTRKARLREPREGVIHG